MKKEITKDEVVALLAFQLVSENLSYKKLGHKLGVSDAMAFKYIHDDVQMVHPRTRQKILDSLGLTAFDVRETIKMLKTIDRDRVSDEKAPRP